jgi:glyoxylase-like metal-dependent hydrolase (beta-lactamase superfamily II)
MKATCGERPLRSSPMASDPIDLLHVGSPRTIGAYVVETEDGPALFDCGPTSTIGRLETGLAERGLALTDVRHLLLSHIHLDHAGAAGVLVRRHPDLVVHVSEVGAPHIVDPARLEASARRLYGEAFDELWGELAPVPAANVRIAEGAVAGLEAFPTPGHARHHVSYLHSDGTLYAGDAAGVRIEPARFVLPPCPPPEIDLEAWERSLDEIERRGPARLAVIHFGVFDDVQSHLARLRETLGRWSAWVEDGMDEPTFVAAASADVASSDPGLEEVYQRAAPLWHTYLGLERYHRKRREGAAS